MRKPSRGSRAYFAAGVVMAVVAVLTGRTGDRPSGRVGPSEAVVMAADGIARGSSLHPEHLRIDNLPQAYVPPGALHQIEQAAGRVALADLAPGEVVTETRLARVRAGPVASLVPRGLRAFAVPSSLPPGAVHQGDRVDVVATYASDAPRTELVVSAVDILAILGPGSEDGGGLDLDAAGSGAGAVTTLLLLVSPEQQERLAFARAFANLEVTIVSAQ